MQPSSKESERVRSEEHEGTYREGQEVRVATLPEMQRDISASKAIATWPRAAFIGTRRVDDTARLSRSVYLDSVEWAVAHQFIVRTGAAQGADQIAAARALRIGGRVELVLPWEGYEQRWIDGIRAEFPDQISIEVYHPEQHKEWTDSVVKYHPAPERLDVRAWRLHARNYGIIEPSLYVVALVHPSRQGGTEQGVRIALALEKATHVLAYPDKQ